MTLQWTAPGDDWLCGTAQEYRVLRFRDAIAFMHEVAPGCDIANSAVTGLSEFLRYTLDQDPMKKVTVAQEMEREGVTEQQLANANEPDFSAALDARLGGARCVVDYRLHSSGRRRSRHLYVTVHDGERVIATRRTASSSPN